MYIFVLMVHNYKSWRFLGHAIIVSYVCIDRNIKGDVSLHELYRLFRTRTQYCFIKDSDLKNVSDIAALNSTDMRFIYFEQKNFILLIIFTGVYTLNLFWLLNLPKCARDYF